MRRTVIACLLLSHASAGRLAAQEHESSSLVQCNLRELQSPPEIESNSSNASMPNMPSEIIVSLPQLPTVEWVQNLRLPHRDYPRPLAWWYGNGDSEPREGNWCSREWGVFCDEAHDTCLRLWRDVQYQYGWYPLGELGVAVALAAPLANTHADQAVANWYQHHIRSSSTDSISQVGYFLGYFQYMVPIYFGVWTAGRLCDESFAGAVSADWASRSLRALAIGAPEVGALQYLLGASRPNDFSGTTRPDNFDGSHWRPFNDNNGVSGHAFVGAVPFLTAASMTDNCWLRGALFVGSTWSAWSRINTDSHYLSQVLLGWFIAFQSVRSVNRTEAEEHRIQIAPWIDPGITGINVFLRY